MAALRLGDKTCNYPLYLEHMLPIIPQREEGGVSEELCLFLFHMLFSLRRLGSIYLENTNLSDCVWKPESLTSTIAVIHDYGRLGSFTD